MKSFLTFIVLVISLNSFAQKKCTLTIANASFVLRSKIVNDTVKFELPDLFMIYLGGKDYSNLNNNLKINNLSNPFSKLKNEDVYNLELPYGSIKDKIIVSDSITKIIYNDLNGQFPYGVVNIGYDFGSINQLLQYDKLINLKIENINIPLKGIDIIVAGENIIRYQIKGTTIDIKSILQENKNINLLIIDKLKFDNSNIDIVEKSFIWRKL